MAAGDAVFAKLNTRMNPLPAKILRLLPENEVEIQLWKSLDKK